MMRNCSVFELNVDEFGKEKNRVTKGSKTDSTGSVIGILPII